MPFEIKHPSPRCWSVVNTKTGKVHSKCSTKKNAERQMKLLYGIESGKWEPTGMMPKKKKTMKGKGTPQDKKKKQDDDNNNSVENVKRAKQIADAATPEEEGAESAEAGESLWEILPEVLEFAALGVGKKKTEKNVSMKKSGMTNAWISHVKAVAAKKGISYREALKVASASYKGRATKGAPSKTRLGEEDYTTKKGDVVFHQKGKYVRKSRLPYAGGEA